MAEPAPVTDWRGKPIWPGTRVAWIGSAQEPVLTGFVTGMRLRHPFHDWTVVLDVEWNSYPTPPRSYYDVLPSELTVVDERGMPVD